MIFELSFFWYSESYGWYSCGLFLILWILWMIFELSFLWYYESGRWYSSCLLSYTLNPIDDILSKMLNTVKKLKYFGRIGWIWVLFKLCLFWIQYKFYSIQYLSSVYTSAVMLIGSTQVWKKKYISKILKTCKRVCCTFLVMKRRIRVISLRPL